ncbi:hypothetical protein FX985_00629 [Pseudomonas extremaustralis]|uniref:Uncharacterized protein n=1 Tax=Pseudomonas extremaustralis TaxID=359110 RepID=A0A5M9IXI9_9PSED|nr:hypothetical protein [Pseudomonas extremaustralis]KAA8560579.1 hypothetical protein FX985_00629 [Pseudomonas extremaustralis]
MPAPDLTPQTPGDPLANAISTATASTGNLDANAQAPAVPDFTAKHNGGGRWVVIDANAPQVDGKDVKIGDFTGTKDEALAEATRLFEGGEPLVLDPKRENESKPAATASTDTIDATTLKQAVMTPEGWLCPEPVAKG